MKKRSILFVIAILLYSFILLQSCQTDKPLSKEYPNKVLALVPEKAQSLAEEIRDEVNVELADGLQLTLWASDSLVADPIAISMSPSGDIYYTQGNRLEHSEFDIRGHRDWMTESISWQDVEDRRAFLRKTFTDDSEQSKKFLEDLNKDGVLNWKDLTVEKEEIWRVTDSNDDGFADAAQLYIQDFHEEISDLANGVEFHDDDVYVAVGPDLWKTRDVDGDGIADDIESLAHGFAVHIGFGAHGMSGVTVGPDGRIWWGIGDIGMNVVDKNGKRWKYPNQGVIVRCETDGSNFEVFSAGHRNTHEFVFDKYGNLISEDNDGDHQGERERLVYIVNGNDSGWRINWQFGKYTDPKNNSYKVWMDEKMNVPRWDGQAAYIVPPIVNYVNGPTGMVYNPGTAISEKWKDHFFIAEFRGTPANSPIHAFTLKPEGAGFALEQTVEVAKGLLPTGLDFGPDGALYFGDWIDGWGTKHLGRLWKIDDPTASQSPIRLETKALLQSDFKQLSIAELAGHLGHVDMRVRQKAQFQLAKRGDDGYQQLLSTATSSSNQLARIHGLWGMGQFARRETSKGADFVKFLADPDPEIIAQAAKQIGDFRYGGASAELIALVSNKDPRIQFFATEALGRTADKSGIDAIINMLIENDNKDVYLRHGGTLALSRIGEEAPIHALASHPSRALRIAAVVTLRRMQSPAVSSFLSDADDYIVAEAARAINDDWSIEASLDDLAKLLDEDRFTNEVIIRRAINANLRVGKQANLDRLVAYANKPTAPGAMRSEALETIKTWSEPSLHDRVDGRYRGVIKRDKAPVRQAIAGSIGQFLGADKSDVVISAIQIVGNMGLTDQAPAILDLLSNHKKSDVRSEALHALNDLKVDNLKLALQSGLADKSRKVRSTALSLIPESNLAEENAIDLFESILEKGSNVEKQAVIGSLSKYTGSQSVAMLGSLFDSVKDKSLGQELHLDVLEAIKAQANDKLVSSLGAYQDSKDSTNPIAEYTETMYGGDADRGQQIFYRNEAAQCVRCHAIFEWGGDAGPGLHGLASRMSKEDILESLIEPSAKIATGFGVVSLDLKDGTSEVGAVLNETDDAIQIRIGKDDVKSIAKSTIDVREDLPSSMPGVKTILDKMQIRDLVAFLSNLKAEES